MLWKNILCNIWMGVEYLNLNLCNKSVNKQKNENKKLYQIMNTAYNIPLYRKKFEEVNLMPDDFRTVEDLPKFPSLSKEELREWMLSEIAAGKDKHNFVNSTSGSSGIPLKVIYGIREKATANANWLYLLKIHGYNPLFDKTMAIKINAYTTGKGRDSFIQKLGFYRRYVYSSLEDVSKLVKALNYHQPVLLYASKSTLVRMVLYANKKGIDLYKPKLICSTSELLDDLSYKIITDYFGKILFQSYGAEEVSAFTYTNCDNPNKHYIMWNTHTFFVKDSKGSVISEGIGNIYVTSLYQKKFPIINYDLKDDVEIFKEMGITYIKKICGRMTDWFEFANGDKVGYLPFYALAENCPYCFQMRFIQENYHLIRIQLVKNDCTETKAEIEQYIGQELKKLLKRNDLYYEYEWMDAIPLDENKKIKFMISKIKGTK